MIHFGQGSTKRPSLGLEKLGPFLWKLTGSASRGGLSACGPVGVGGYLNCSIATVDHSSSRTRVWGGTLRVGH